MQRFGRAVGLLDQAAQRFAGAELNKCVDPLLPHMDDDLLPADRTADLPGQKIPVVPGVGAGGVIRIELHPRLPQRRVLQHLGEADGSGGHIRRVEAAADLQGDQAAAGLLDIIGQKLELLPGACHGNLAGAVVVDRVNMLVPGAEIFHRGVLQLDDGAHAAVRLAGRLVHQFTTAADKVETVLQRDGAGIGQRGDLAQGEPGGALAGDGL